MRSFLFSLFQKLLLFSALLALPAGARASGTAYDGSNLVALFVRAEQIVEFRTLEGELKSTIAVSDNSHSNDQLYPVLYAAQPAILAVRTKGKRELGTATLFSANGKVSSLDLGSLRDTYLFGYDLSGNGNLDLLTVDRRGQIRIIWSAFSGNDETSRYRIKKKAFDKVTLTSQNGANALVILRSAGGAKAKKGASAPVKFADLYSLGSTIRLERIRTGKLRGELRPIVSGASFSESRFLLVNPGAKRIQYGLVNLRERKFKRQRSSGNASFFAGSFTGNNPQILISEGGVLSHFDAASDLALLAEYNLLEAGSYTPGYGEPGGNPGGGTCVSEMPASLLSQIAAAYNANNFALLSQLVNQIPWGQLCPQTMQETYQALSSIMGLAGGGITHASQFYSPESFRMLEAPFRSPGPAQLIRDCDVLRPSTDGPGGFVYKTGEKDGKVAVLLPSSIYSSAAWLATPKGKNIEKLKHDGRTNGWRDTYRAKNRQNQYPRKLIVKARVNTGYGEEKNYCWTLENSHVRND